MTIRRAAIVAPMRTPVGTFGGSLRDVPVEDLAATAVKAETAENLAVKYGITRGPARTALGPRPPYQLQMRAVPSRP
jgi:hypothetical protein